MADPTEIEEGSEDQPPKRNWRKEAEDRAKQDAERIATLERELAFNKAGLTHLNDDQVKALVAVHEGEMTPDALKATSSKLFGAAPAGQSTPAETETDHGDEAAELATLTGSTGPTQEPRPTGKPSYEQVTKDAAALAADQDQLIEYLESHGFGDF